MSRWITPKRLMLKFGKYEGQSLSEVYAKDPHYVEWLAREHSDPDIRYVAGKICEYAPVPFLSQYLAAPRKKRESKEYLRRLFRQLETKLIDA